jgi:hypothetical protein
VVVGEELGGFLEVGMEAQELLLSDIVHYQVEI